MGKATMKLFLIHSTRRISFRYIFRVCVWVFEYHHLFSFLSDYIGARLYTRNYFKSKKKKKKNLNLLNFSLAASPSK